MDTLKQSVRDSDTQREKAEVKLAEAIARDHENQVNRRKTVLKISCEIMRRRAYNFLFVSLLIC